MVILYLLAPKGWVRILPTLTFMYPDNGRESQIVALRASNRTKKEIEMFELSDPGVHNAFKIILKNVDPVDIYRISTSRNAVIKFWKYLINRPRPIQVNRSIEILDSTTANTPSYPSGHSYQAFLVAMHYSAKYPELSDDLYSMAEAIGQSRIAAGLHYPSDHEFSKKLLNFL